MFRRSPKPAASPSGSTHLLTGKLSPVNAASETCRPIASITRPSAAIASPSSMSKMSPGTTWLARTFWRWPSRSTVAVAAVIRRSAATACSARASWMKPRTAFASTMTRIVSVSKGSSESRSSNQTPLEITAATSNNATSGFWNWATKRRQAGGGGSAASAFGPNWRSRAAASVDVRPRAGSLPRLVRTASAVSWYFMHCAGPGRSRCGGRPRSRSGCEWWSPRSAPGPHR